MLVLHNSISQKILHCFLNDYVHYYLNAVPHQMPLLHNVVITSTQLNHFFIMRKIIVFDVVTFRFKFSQRTKVRLLNLNLMCLVKIQFFFAFVFFFLTFHYIILFMSISSKVNFFQLIIYIII